VYEKRSDFFVKLFDATGIGYELKSDGSIDNNCVLRHGGSSLKAYYNEATDSRGPYFALNGAHYSSFGKEHWIEARNARIETTHLKLIPYPGDELSAVEEIIQFNLEGSSA
jgi:hypothetical protein